MSKFNLYEHGMDSETTQDQIHIGFGIGPVKKVSDQSTHDLLIDIYTKLEALAEAQNRLESSWQAHLAIEQRQKEEAEAEEERRELSAKRANEAWGGEPPF